MKKKSLSALPYRRGVGIVLINGRGQVFVAERIDTPGAWQLPQGGIDKGETPRAAACRELREEVGTAKARIICVTPGWVRYDLPKSLVGKVWGGRYRGQEQKWYLMRFTGKDADIDLETHHPEFSAWKWTSFHQLPRVAAAFKRDIYREVVRVFAARVAKVGRVRTTPRRLKRRPRSV